jgi:hypothetical protein
MMVRNRKCLVLNPKSQIRILKNNLCREKGWDFYFGTPDAHPVFRDETKAYNSKSTENHNVMEVKS